MRIPVPGDSALIILPPEAIGERIDRWRRVYDPNQHTIPPHITLVYPPFVPQEAWDELRAPLAALLAGFLPFTVTLRTTEVFIARPAVLWLRPEEDTVIGQLHAAITAQFPEYALPLPFDYVPHLTIGLFATPDALAEARQVVSAELTPLHFRVDKVAYAVLDHGGAWCHCDELPLGSLSVEAATDA